MFKLTPEQIKNKEWDVTDLSLVQDCIQTYIWATSDWSSRLGLKGHTLYFFRQRKSFSIQMVDLGTDQGDKLDGILQLLTSLNFSGEYLTPNFRFNVERPDHLQQLYALGEYKEIFEHLLTT